MQIGSIFLLLTVLLIISAIVIQPFFRKKAAAGSPSSSASDHVLSGLLAEKERILSALQELDFDNSLGKIPLEQYPLQRNVLVQKGAEILSSLDKLGYKPGPSIGSMAKTNNHEKPAYDDLEEIISRRRIEKNGKNKGFCSKCGNAIHEADKFCPKCGTTV